MQSQDLKFLENAFEAFIYSSINRVAHSGEMTYTYRITAAEVKTATDRQRLHESVIGDFKNFFASQNVPAQYDDDFAAFSVVIDLNRCVLTPKQAEYLSTGMETFRMEHM